MLAITLLLVALIVIAAIPATVGVFLAVRMYKASCRYHRTIFIRTVGKPKRPSAKRKKRRKPYELERDGLLSLEEIASEAVSGMGTIGEGWRVDNEWDNAVKALENREKA